jgi:hypothetical protein
MGEALSGNWVVREKTIQVENIHITTFKSSRRVPFATLMRSSPRRRDSGHDLLRAAGGGELRAVRRLPPLHVRLGGGHGLAAGDGLAPFALIPERVRVPVALSSDFGAPIMLRTRRQQLESPQVPVRV